MQRLRGEGLKRIAEFGAGLLEKCELFESSSLFMPEIGFQAADGGLQSRCGVAEFLALPFQFRNAFGQSLGGGFQSTLALPFPRKLRNPRLG